MAEQRPSLPAELRRSVLVEAGHRCAIHTCRATQVDVHHIVPWRQLQEHHLENLIALCPNCHRQAERGEIDRKALLMYKARLAAAFKFDEPPHYPREMPSTPSFSWADSQARWRTLVEESYHNNGDISVELEYPELSASILGAGDFNSHAKVQVIQARDEFIRAINEFDYGSIPSGLGSYLSSSFAIASLTADLISVRFFMQSYYRGAAHPNSWTEVVNFKLGVAPKRLYLEDVFVDLELGVRILSSYCKRELLTPTQDRPARSAPGVESGAGPDPRNFRPFNLTPHGILVSFDPYTVASYAEGPSEVTVPYEDLSDALNPDLSLPDKLSEPSEAAPS